MQGPLVGLSIHLISIYRAFSVSQALCVMPGGSREGKTTTSHPSRGLRNRVESLPSSAAPRTELDLTAGKGAHVPSALSPTLFLCFFTCFANIYRVLAVCQTEHVREIPLEAVVCALGRGLGLGQGEQEGEEGVQGCRCGWGSGS